MLFLFVEICGNHEAEAQVRLDPRVATILVVVNV
jgi:hypothetical protein